MIHFAYGATTLIVPLGAMRGEKRGGDEQSYVGRMSVKSVDKTNATDACAYCAA